MSSNRKSKDQNEGEEKKKSKPKEYNPHWRGYLYIFISSLINLSAASDVSGEYQGVSGVAIMFGCVTLGLSFLILLFDRTKWLENFGDFHKAFDGMIQGIVLIIFVLWWVVGVAYQTQVGGVAYLAINVYFSSWMSLAFCVYTLNLWSTEKDILSITELTGISETLPSWYILLLGSIIVSGTSINLWLVVYTSLTSDAAFGMALGLASLVISFTWILAHYNFIELFNEGGWLEFGSSIVVIIIWIVGVAVLTSFGAVGATFVGSGCTNSDGIRAIRGDLDDSESDLCNVTWVDSQQQFNSIPCDDLLEQVIPGSNMYCGLWLCLGASVHIAFAWKKQQARNLAKAQNKKSPELGPRESGEYTASSGVNLDGRDAEIDVDNDEDVDDDFQDADVY